MVYYVAGDIGGTKSRLRLLHRENEKTELKLHKQYDSNAFPSLTAVILQFLQESCIRKEDWPQYCCLAVAGPVVNNECKFTNIKKWPLLVGVTMAKELGMKSLLLVNDFVGVGYGLTALTPQDYTVLQKGEPMKNGLISCVGAGTGLGECLLTWNGREYDAWGTEGGHTEFSPTTEEQWKLREYIKKVLGIHRVSVERVVSGSGIPFIYDFLCHEYPEKAMLSHERDLQNKLQEAKNNHGNLISSDALNNKYGLAAQAMRLFAACYGAEAGDMALKTLSFGGCYIAGGVAPRNMWCLEEHDRFTKNFRDKGRMNSQDNPIMSRIPIYVIHKDVEVGMLGAQVVCERMIKESLKGAVGPAKL